VAVMAAFLVYLADLKSTETIGIYSLFIYIHIKLPLAIYFPILRNNIKNIYIYSIVATHVRRAHG
jgi:hypothetical protein|tara:strand:- start:480 stop:674 length:195 start_codon:yes stop_codon:yes gene_type:complete